MMYKKLYICVVERSFSGRRPTSCVAASLRWSMLKQFAQAVKSLIFITLDISITTNGITPNVSYYQFYHFFTILATKTTSGKFNSPFVIHAKYCYQVLIKFEAILIDVTIFRIYYSKYMDKN